MSVMSVVSVKKEFYECKSISLHPGLRGGKVH